MKELFHVPLFNTVHVFIFIDSEVFKIVKTSGVSDYTHQVYERAGRGVLFVNNYFENNFPEYYQATALFIEPYITLSKDLGLVLYNFFERIRENIIAKYPQLIESVGFDFISIIIIIKRIRIFLFIGSNLSMENIEENEKILASEEL